LIIGADGTIGKALVEKCVQSKISWWGSSRHNKLQGERIFFFDLSSELPAELPRADVVVICAAQTQVAYCEANPEESRKINVDAPLRLARHYSGQGASLVFLSTSLVFGGKSAFANWDKPLSPETEYGRQKADAEKSLTPNFPNTAVFRLGKVLHPELALFCNWSEQLGRGEVIRPFFDMTFSPVSLKRITDEIFKMITGFSPGIYQLSGNREVSYAEAARLLAREIKVDEKLIQPTSWKMANLNPRFVSEHNTMACHLPNGSEESPDVEEALSENFKHYIR
jgi:dTDP-4-dehydrorhamnose reductase